MRQHITAGYVAFNGYVFTQRDADIYNNALDIVANDNNEAALNHAHLVFSTIIGDHKNG